MAGACAGLARRWRARARAACLFSVVQANASTIVMPCNYSGFFDPVFASQCERGVLRSRYTAIALLHPS
jgi:hypothetical protein